MQNVDICEKTLIPKLLKKFIKIALFASIYLIATMFIQNYFHYENSVGIALITLGILGYVYTLSLLVHEKLYKKLYDKVNIDVIEYCIAKSRSMSYGEIIYFPYIKYRYTFRQKRYASTSVCWDFESCYDTRWIESDTAHNEDIIRARKKIESYIKQKEAYVLKLLPFVSYLDIRLSEKRKRYFLFFHIFSVILFFAGVFAL